VNCLSLTFIQSGLLAKGLETVKLNGCTCERPQYSRDLFRAKTLDNWHYCKVGCYVFRNRQRKNQRCKCIMLESYLCEVFAKDKQQHYCGDLVLGWAVLQKTVFNH